MAARISAQDETISDINIVPLVDIILVVLIIFMVTAPAMIKPSLQVDLPEAASAEASEPTFLQVAISSDGRILVNNLEVDESLAREMARSELQKNPSVQAMISADENAVYGTIIRVMDWLKSEGVKDFAVSTDKPLQKVSEK
jgi:biopolymer transport protein ExbD